jgi:hypothetical protein
MGLSHIASGVAACALWFGAVTTVTAQQRLDLPRYSVELPAGWSSQVDGDRWTLYPSGGAHELGIAPVGSGIPIDSTHTRADAHRQLWATALGSRQVLQATPTQEQKRDDGRVWTIDSAAVEEGGVVYLLVLSVAELNGRAEGFLLIGTPIAIQRHQAEIDSILNSVRFRTVAQAAPVRARDKAPVFGKPSPLGTPGPGRLAGVWTTTNFELQYGLGGAANKQVTSELILFADGAALWGMPSEGLLGFDRAAHRVRWPDRWETYVLRDKRIAITRAGIEREYAILPNGALEHRYMEAGLERKGDRYLPRPSLNAITLEGEVRRKGHWPAPGNTSGIGTVGGCTFAKDGTFRDERLMWVVLPKRDGESQEAYQTRVAPGQGWYRLEHWSLVLEYDDGRINQVSFVAMNPDQPTKWAILNGYPIEPYPY